MPEEVDWNVALGQYYAQKGKMKLSKRKRKLYSVAFVSPCALLFYMPPTFKVQGQTNIIHTVKLHYRLNRLAWDYTICKNKVFLEENMI